MYPGDRPAISSSSPRTIACGCLWPGLTGPPDFPAAFGAAQTDVYVTPRTLRVNYRDTTPMTQLGLKCGLKRKLSSSERLGGWWEARTLGGLGHPQVCFKYRVSRLNFPGR